MLNQNKLEKILQIKPVKWVSNGFSIAHSEGKTIFLTGGILGKEEEFIVEKENSHIIYARSVNVESDCRVFPKCGGCSYRHIPYPEELEIKKNELLAALKLDYNKEISIDSIEIKTIIGPTIHYRNNVQWKKSNSKIGFFSRFSNELVDLVDIGCKNLDPLLRHPPHDKNSELSLRVSQNQIIPYLKKNTEVSIGNYKFQIPAGGFQQVNSYLVPKWLEFIKMQIERLSKKSKKMDCLELFCGSGMIGQFVSETIQALYGMEAIHKSIEFAKTNAKNNHINNFRYKKMDLYKPFPIKEIPNHPLWILNPPRSGAGKEVINLWKIRMPKIVIYSSCDAQTLARDWKEIQEATNEYSIETICLLDFFPRTKHFETVVVFIKKDFQESLIIESEGNYANIG